MDLTSLRTSSLGPRAVGVVLTALLDRAFVQLHQLWISGYVILNSRPTDGLETGRDAEFIHHLSSLSDAYSRLDAL